MSFYLNISRQAAPAPQPACTNVTKLSNELLEAKVVFAVVVMAILAGVMSVVGVERLIRGRFTLFSKLSGLELKKGAETATQVILACHLATELLEMKHVVMVDKKAKKKKATRKMNRDERRDYRLHRGVATALSRYCMYLVARSPELLPDNERWVSDRYGDMKDFLKEASRRRCCCCCPFRLWKCGCWRTVLMDMDADDVADPAAKAGVKLFRELDKADAASAAWEGLFDFWTKMVVYIAPSNDVEGHASALAGNGGDLITYLWALCTHAGIIRDPSDDKSPEGGQV